MFNCTCINYKFYLLLHLQSTATSSSSWDQHQLVAAEEAQVLVGAWPRTNAGMGSTQDLGMAAVGLVMATWTVPEDSEVEEVGSMSVSKHLLLSLHRKIRN